MIGARELTGKELCGRRCRLVIVVGGEKVRFGG